MATQNETQYWLDVFKKELYEEIIPWWLTFSIDNEHGGFFNCIHKDGSLYDTSKYVWLQGRQVWMFAKLYGDQSFEDNLFKKQNFDHCLTKDALLKNAISGADFLIQNSIRDLDGHVWFCLRNDGKPVQMQRKPWAACFLVMGLFELVRVMPACNVDKAVEYCKKGFELFHNILEWFEVPALLGSKFGPGQVDTSSLAVPMILLNICIEIRGMIEGLKQKDKESFQHFEGLNIFDIIDVCSKKEEWCIKEIKRHIKYDSDGNVSKVLETVGLQGEEIESPAGRLINPGHVIEAGWFLMQYSEGEVLNDDVQKEKLFSLGKNLATWALDIGWDKQYDGGILYFLDSSKKFSPIELEWDHKLWWPHTEALIAFLMAYEKTGEKSCWDNFVKVAEYTMTHFKDQEKGGEWFGYLNRRGELTHDFKGAPYKGCFHVPRAIWMCINILKRIN